MPSDHDLLVSIAKENQHQTATLKEIRSDVKALKRESIEQDKRISAIETGISTIKWVGASIASVTSLVFAYIKLKGQ